LFAECIPSGTRRTSSLLSVTLKTLRKKSTRQTGCFAECQNKNTQRRGCLPSVKKINSTNRNKIFFLKKKEKKKIKKNFTECSDLKHSTKKSRRRKKLKKNFAECPIWNTRQTTKISARVQNSRPHPFGAALWARDGMVGPGCQPQ